MAAIKSADMKPEMIVRSMAHRLGYRYRLHARDLPGKPDLVFRSRRKAIFVHGCFWHQHKNSKCVDGRMPKSNLDYWQQKLETNVSRDKRNLTTLKALGWKTLVVWECEILRAPEQIRKKLRSFLG
jgi:DNA mismatch endonuclease, patch repair protein